MGDLIEFNGGQKSTNRQCPKCGSEWWVVQAVVIDVETEGINGYAGIPECHLCEHGGAGASLTLIRGDK